jgi:hypothetical protein
LARIHYGRQQCLCHKKTKKNERLAPPERLREKNFDERRVARLNAAGLHCGDVRRGDVLCATIGCKGRRVQALIAQHDGVILKSWEEEDFYGFLLYSPYDVGEGIKLVVEGQKTTASVAVNPCRTFGVPLSAQFHETALASRMNANLLQEGAMTSILSGWGINCTFSALRGDVQQLLRDDKQGLESAQLYTALCHVLIVCSL